MFHLYKDILMANNEIQLRKSLRDCFYIALPFAIIITIIGLMVKFASSRYKS
jgi:hypothetical protein